MKFDYFSVEHCFIIGHKVKDKFILEEFTNNFVMAGFHYFNLRVSKVYL